MCVVSPRAGGCQLIALARTLNAGVQITLIDFTRRRALSEGTLGWTPTDTYTHAFIYIAKIPISFNR